MIDAVLQVPPFHVRIRSPLDSVARHLEFFYPGALQTGRQAFVDFDIEILPGAGLRRWWHPQARFVLDGNEPFLPLPAEQAAPMFEWGLNWCVAQRALGFLVMHAAVLARGGQALMLPGFPGAGKSTLCASLALCEHWRLLSDELAILDPADTGIVPHPRPISLKNRSIEIVRGFPGHRIGRIYEDTRKGVITHAACPPQALEAAAERARVAWVVFPRFEEGSQLQCEPISRVEAFTLISEQSFNKERMGEIGFRALCDLLGAARCYELTYGSTADGLAGIRRICQL